MHFFQRAHIYRLGLGIAQTFSYPNQYHDFNTGSVPEQNQFNEQITL